MHGAYIIQLYLLICMSPICLVDAAASACVSFNIFTILLEPACIISCTCSRIFGMHAYMNMYAYAFTAAAYRNGSYTNV